MIMTPEKKSHIWLSSFEALSYKHKSLLTEAYGGAVNLVKKFKQEAREIEKIIGAELYGEMANSLSPSYLQPILDSLEEKGIDALTIEDENYPENLKNSEDPPYILYILGDISLLSGSLITIVGTRKSTRYGEEQTELIAKGLCEKGFTIVSGLAEGIDTIANTAGLKYGKTIAVVTGGFNNIYPASNQKLFFQIAQNGLILSEYLPHVTAKPFMFPIRNRIMAALSDAVVITEAGENSGALITANTAINLGRELFVLPGNVNSAASKGANKLLKEMQGAFITCCEDILQHFGIETEEEKQPQKTVDINELNSTEKAIYLLLERGETHIEQIMAQTKLSAKDANTILSVMEIKGLIKKLPGNTFGI